LRAQFGFNWEDWYFNTTKKYKIKKIPSKTQTT